MVMYSSDYPRRMGKKMKSISRLNWRYILFGNLEGFSSIIKECCCASTLMWLDLFALMGGREYINEGMLTLCKDFSPIGWGHLLHAYKDYQLIRNMTFLLPKLVECNTNIHLGNRLFSHAMHQALVMHIRPHGEGFADGLRYKSSKVYIPVTGESFITGGISYQSSHMGLYTIRIELSPFYGHMDRPPEGCYEDAWDLAGTINRNYLFKDHAAWLVHRCIQTIHRVPNRQWVYQMTTAQIVCRNVTMVLRHNMGYNVFQFSQHDRTSNCMYQPTHHLQHDLVQRVLIFLCVFDKQKGRDHQMTVKESSYWDPQITINFLPFIESILRSSCFPTTDPRPDYYKIIPSNPWTLAFIHFVRSPVIIPFRSIPAAVMSDGFCHRLYDVEYDRHYGDDILHVLEWWINVLRTEFKHRDDLYANPLHNQFDMSIFHIVCSQLFLNIFRGVVLALLEPYILRDFMSNQDYEQVRSFHAIQDYNMRDCNVGVEPCRLPHASGNDGFLPEYEYQEYYHSDNEFVVYGGIVGTDRRMRLTFVLNELIRFAKEPSHPMSVYPLNISKPAPFLTWEVSKTTASFETFMQSIMACRFSFENQRMQAGSTVCYLRQLGFVVRSQGGIVETPMDRFETAGPVSNGDRSFRNLWYATTNFISFFCPLWESTQQDHTLEV